MDIFEYLSRRETTGKKSGFRSVHPGEIIVNNLDGDPEIKLVPLPAAAGSYTEDVLILSIGRMRQRRGTV